MELFLVVFILLSGQAHSKVYWIVSNKPVIYGDNIILTCKTDRAECRVRQWYSGHKHKLLLFNTVSVNATKYEDRSNLSSTEFSLVIKNYTESDLNINYTCSCGFKSYTKVLGLTDNNFIVPPLTVDFTIQQSNETLSIYIHVERVYPYPECSVVIGERTVFDKLTLTFVKRGEFYYGTYEASFNIVDDDCGRKPTFVCYIGNEYNIVNTSGEPIQNCTEVNGDGGNTPGYNSTSTEGYLADMFKYGLSCAAILGFLGGIIIFIIRRRTCISRSIQKGKGILITKTDDIIASDSDHRNKILAMKSEMLNPTDSGVDLNDEKCSLQSDKNVSIEDIL